MPAPLPSTRGFIVARLPFGDTSLILRAITAPAGRLTLMAKGARRPKSPFTGQLDLFYEVEIHYYPTRSGEIHTLREVRLLDAHLGLRHSYANLMAAHYFAALIESATEAGTPIGAEYELLARAIGYLAEKAVTRRAIDRFEQHLLRLAGGQPGPGGRAEAGAPVEFTRAFAALHLQVPGLRGDLLRLVPE